MVQQKGQSLGYKISSKARLRIEVTKFHNANCW